MDFSGGLNTETSNERLTDNEFIQMENVDLNSRGSVKKRTGRDLMQTYFKINGQNITGTPSFAQGLFFFNRKNKTEPDIIFAVEGMLFVKKYLQVFQRYDEDAHYLNILGLQNGFSPVNDVEAVQYYDRLYVATGANLVVVTVNETSGEYSAKVVEPYEPNANELKFIGTNSLLGFSMSDTINTSFTNIDQFSIKGITFKEPGTEKTLINAEVKKEFLISSFLNYNNNLNYDLNISFQYRKVDSQKKATKTEQAIQGQFVFTVNSGSSYDINTNSIEVYKGSSNLPLVSGVDYIEENSHSITLTAQASHNEKYTLKWIESWRSGNTSIGKVSTVGVSSNQVKFTPLEVGYYDFKFVYYFSTLVPPNSHTTEYVYQGVQVKSFKEEGDILEKTVSGVKYCNRIRLHYDRLMLFGDPNEPTQLYFSDINNPEYFPEVNTFRFDTGKQEPIISVVRLNDYLVVFSKTLIHVLTGRSKEDFAVNLINDSIGCVAPRSAVLTGNVITFLSEEGVFQLRPSTFKLDQLNVKRVDSKIKSELEKYPNACALNYDSQYWLCFPSKKIIYRYYYERDVWVKDVSDKLNFVQFLQDGQNVYTLSQDVKLYKNNENIYTDAGMLYNMIVETKYFDLSKSFNFKKLRRLYILARGYDDYDAEYKVKVFADSAIILDPEVGYAVVNTHQNGIDYSEWFIENPTKPNIEFHQASVFGSWVLGEDFLGGSSIDVQKARIRGKCRRTKLQFINSQDKEVELFGFGLEFKLKKP